MFKFRGILLNKESSKIRIPAELCLDGIMDTPALKFMFIAKLGGMEYIYSYHEIFKTVHVYTVQFLRHLEGVQ